MGAQLIVEFFTAGRFVLIAEGGMNPLPTVLSGIGPEHAASEIEAWIQSGATWSFDGRDLLMLNAGDARLSVRGI